MDKPVFLMSFDCEGKWGLADMLSEHHDYLLTNQNLDLAYQRLLKILDDRGLHATFAFVGAFTMSLDEFHANEEWFKDTRINGKDWLSHFRKDMADGAFDGWLNPIPFEIVKRTQQHEIASHGFTHIPLSESSISEKTFLREMKSLSRLSEMKNIPFHTFVYPRNQIGFPSLLGNATLIGYRDSLYHQRTRWNRALELFGELNIRQEAQVHGVTEKNIVRIPSGYFLNWRANLRKRIPLSITLRRWKHAIQDAIDKCKVIHLTSHPQDFIDGDGQFLLLDEILKFVALKRNVGEILNLTLYEYCSTILR